MKIEHMTDGYWLASGGCNARFIVAEGATRAEAVNAWIAMAAAHYQPDFPRPFPEDTK